ncbi:ABC transporter ATP-binding protein [Facklamia sp. DSM 111018]|uniref:ABC transporter ATP-binding protein n=1 Tax=Facklamia lactis TaxID=2749967 RepID=A0ABS0LN75_9LACT|nr:ABC transporter ATP-binding protein [Facklamia lactis]MBG9979883.1 ABC transporter ATP-binding protein [Facklamia lactis]MBG9985437.1 ABC transporter ATP-binding protein [Facklamia lactis]
MNKIHKQTSFSFLEQFSLLAYLFSFAKKQWWRFTISILAMLAASSIAAYLPIIIQRYLDNLLVTNSATYKVTLQVALTYLGLLIVRMILVYIKDFYFFMASEYTVAQIRNRIYQKLGGLSLNYFTLTPNGEVVSRVTNDTETIKEFWNVFLTFFDGFINAVTVGIAMFSLNSQISWAFMAFLPLIFALIYFYQKISTIVYRKMRSALGQVNARLSESTTGMWLIQQFNQTERMKQEFDEVNQDYVTARIDMFKMNALCLMPAVNLIEQIVLVLVIIIFGRQLLKGMDLDIGIIYAFTSYSKSFFNPIGSMLDSLSIYQDGLVAASRGRDLLANPDLIPTQSSKQLNYEIQGKLAIDNVSFSYDGIHNVIRDISVRADQGQMIALVGHTGSGKSTIINLLMRFYEYEKGTISYDDVSIKDFKIERLRKDIALVQQDAFMFYGNFYDNIRLHGQYSDEEVIKAAKFTGADSFIRELPRGYDTIVSEGGDSLSAGQKQLLNIARSVIRQPNILILDEATANIDTESEQYIQNSLEKIREQSTLIVIAHRLSTIKNADQIYVLHKGKIIEQGKHQELIKQEGTYYDMYRLQSLQQN